eukprot:6473371-Amphidinium_carterae.2
MIKVLIWCRNVFPKVDGMFVSIHGDYLHDSITYAAGKTWVVTINSGSDVSQQLNPAGGQLIGHVGQQWVEDVPAPPTPSLDSQKSQSHQMGGRKTKDLKIVYTYLM